jgi:hypothetical protein
MIDVGMHNSIKQIKPLLFQVKDDLPSFCDEQRNLGPLAHPLSFPLKNGAARYKLRLHTGFGCGL